MGWSKQVEYEKLYNAFIRDYKMLKKKDNWTKRDKKRFFYLISALTQLKNGTRASETIDALLKFVKEKKKEVLIQTKKKSKELRYVILPAEISFSDLDKVRDLILYFDERDYNFIKNKFVKNYSKFLTNNYNVNSHTLRYAFITYLSKQGVSAQVIQQITKHSRLEYITYYTNQSLAYNILKNINSK